MTVRLVFRAINLLGLAAAVSACATMPDGSTANAPVTVGIVAINDFHGSLEPPKQAVAVPDGKGGTVAVPVGGAAWLASAIDSVRANYRNHLTVSAGDLIGASQIASSLYLDEPAIGVANRIGLDFNAVGNHEFDAGQAELLRKQYGGCAKLTARQPCRLEKFGGARFRFLAASTLGGNGATLFPATGFRSFGKGRGKVSVGLIGLTLRDTPNLVSPSGVKGLTFADEAGTINALVPRLKAQGADAVVVLIHQGGRTTDHADPSGCAGLNGAILPILDRIDPRVDVIISGHTHEAYVCEYAVKNASRPLLLTSAGAAGGLVTDIALDIDPRTHRVVARRARNVVVQSAPFASGRGLVDNSDAVPRFTPRADISAYVARYVDGARAEAQRVVGRLAGAAGKGTAGVDQGGPLGNLIADAQLAATAQAGAQLALTNPFGIRAALIPGADGHVTFGMIHAVQPFNNQLVTQSFTGAELKAVLEQAVRPNAPVEWLTPSQEFSYTVNPLAPAGERVAAMTFMGRPINPAATYLVTTNSFLAEGGDGFSRLTAGRDKVTGVSDIEALESWLAASPTRPVPSEARVTQAAP